jgi:pyruvate,water dikinase
MAPIYDIPRKVAFTTKEDVDTNICGRPVDGPAVTPTVVLPLRVLNFLCYIAYFMSAGGRLRKLTRLAASLSLPLRPDLRAMYRDIDAHLPRVFDAWAHHYATSGKSGALNSALLRILESEGSGTTQEHRGTQSGLLTKLGGINGADALAELAAIRKAILEDSRLPEAFLHETSQRCLSLLQTSESGTAGLLFRAFLRNHGHRCIREAELREKDWEGDPEGLVRLLQKNVAFPGTTSGNAAGMVQGDDIESLLSRYSRRTRFIVRRVLPSVRRFVVARENSKSLCIRIQSQFKKAYLHLGGLLAAEGLLDDVDQVFFLTHQELGALVQSPGPWGKEMARARRDLLPSLLECQFDDFSQGIPEPRESPSMAMAREGVLVGIPVSAGVATGKARIINSLSDAELLVPGEIMIASYTDVGWTPYFSSISGLVTEIGSTLSHGAVVAREYGIPAVVNVGPATKLIKTGQVIRVDAGRGEVTILG